MTGTVQQLIAKHRGAVIAPQQGGQSGRTAASPGEFAQLLEKKSGELKISAHAATRLKSRNIELTPEVMGKLETAVTKAAEKGARDSLILLRDNAFIVNIPNRTVITAMESGTMKENVFTNIDSAVIVD